MVEITCQYTGVKFEAASNRSKNHPLVSEFINAASKDVKRYRGAYQAAKDIISSTGETEIEKIIEAANRQYREWVENEKDGINRKNAEESARKKASENARKSRKHQNTILYKHGYRWHKETEESMDFAGPNALSATYGGAAGSAWVLTAPGGTEVSVEEAMEAIKNK